MATLFSATPRLPLLLLLAVPLWACSADDDDVIRADADVTADGDTGGDSSPDATPDTSPDTSPDTASDATTDAEADADADATPDTTTDVTPDTADLADEDGDTCPTPDAFWEDVDLDEFASLPLLADLDFDTVTTAAAVTYWELRFGAPESPFQVVGSSGTLCADATDVTACTTAFEALESDEGFAQGCLPGFCYYYLAVNDGDTNSLITTAEGLETFVGTVDREVEAVLIAFARGYNWSTNNKEQGAVRANQDSYTLVMTRLASGCDPVVIDRHLLLVAADGTFVDERAQVSSVICGACI